ncbi:hypothetical protein BSKO_13963 [Bryopsis sp. KO-2023]|nr:hypothetical protein BSKO_13963 [Bryopsis sp. KO-2023]
MAVNLVVQHRNKRHNVRAGPMKPLSSVLEELCQKLRPRVEPQSCQLLLKGEAVDLSTPLRLMNVPPGAKLELVSSAEPGQPSSRVPVANNPTQAPVGRGETATQTATDSMPTTSDVPTGARDSGVTHTKTGMTEGARGTGADAKGGVNQGPGLDSGNPGMQGVLAGSEQENDNELGGNEGDSKMDGWSSLASVSRKFCLFRRDALVEEGASASDEEVPDDFYDFTAEDFHRVMKEHQQKVAFQEAGLRTKALRQFAEHAKAQALGPVSVRLFFPSGEVCQTEFGATDTIGEVYGFGAGLVKGGRHSFVLYTAPPRLDLVDEELTLYKAQLIPAANVYVGASKPSKKGKRKVGETHGAGEVELREDVKACLMEKPPIRQGDSVEPTKKSENTAKTGAETATVRPAPQAPAKPKKGIPKWMKL